MSKLANVVTLVISLMFVLASAVALWLFIGFLGATPTQPTEAHAMAAAATLALDAAAAEADKAEEVLETAKAAGDGEAVGAALEAAWDARGRATEARIEEARAWEAKAAAEAAPAAPARALAAHAAAAKAVKAVAAKAEANKGFACASAARALADAEANLDELRAVEEAFYANPRPFSVEEGMLLHNYFDQVDALAEISRARANERDAC